MRIKILLSFLLIFNCFRVFATNYPDSILNKKYSVQSTALDTILHEFQVNGYDLNKGVTEFSNLENWASDKGDKQLTYLIRLYQYRFEFNRNSIDGDYEKNLIQLLKETDENKLSLVKADVYQLAGDYYWEKKNFASSLENYIYAYDIYSGIPEKDYPHKPEYLYGLGGKYYHFRDFKAAKKYFLEVWNTIPVEKIDNAVSKMNSLGLCYSNLEEYDSSAFYLNKAIDLAVKMDDELWIGIVSGNLGNNYFKQNKYDEAQKLLEKNVELSTKHHALEDLALSESQLGVIYLIKGDNKRAMEMQMESLDIIKKKNLYKDNGLISRIYPNVAKAYAADGNMNLAYRFIDTSITANKLLEKERNMIYVSGVQHKIDVEKHRAELLKTEAEINHQKLFRNSFIAGFAIVLLFSIGFFYQKNRISKEKKRSDELLLNILPEEVAEELKEKGSADAKLFDNVTVIFTDFKGFTTITEKLSAKELVGEINYCFSAFDNIIHKYGIEKIKTIGDSYMAVGGLPIPSKTHAKDVVNAALEINEFMEEHKQQRMKEGKEIFEIRIGIHTGPVVAGIVGIKKFAYDIWGDTVNLASRMESSGEEGKINISGSTYELVKDDFKCTYRGKIEAKNKGEVDMYFVS